MNSRIMLVEPSATMRYVLKNYTDANGYETDGFTTFGKALNALKRQFEVFDDEYRCVLVGWPSVRDRDSEAFLQLLESADFHDLPVIVLSQDLRADARAWVAGRNHTVLVRWKEYRKVKELLENQLDSDTETESDAFQSKFSNQDVSILVVDDSPSIRYALRDLLKLQGYDVTVVGSYAQAIQIAREQRFDIAVLDYYLQDATGDELCREMLSDPATGDVTCAILTGTYSDHIIKRSLRAGAVECMFKNESSELLLARIDAISRMVRQRKELQLNYLRMDVVIDSLNGAVISYDEQGVLRFANSRALQLLGYARDDEFVGHHLSEILSHDKLDPTASSEKRANFLNAERKPVAVFYTSQDLIEDNRRRGTILSFTTVEKQPPVTAPASEEAAAAVAKPAAPVTGTLDTVRFLGELQHHIDEHDSATEQHSLLLMSVTVHGADGSRSRIAEHPAHLETVLSLLSRVYKRPNSIGYLANDMIGVVLQHKNEKQAYLLTRKFMQIVNTVANTIDGVRFSTCASLLSVEKNHKLEAPQMLSKTRHGLKLVEARGDNLALIVDLKRLLPAYPKK
ncbi:response regulator [Granulosicoccaceae sp. 1_MG-2023]|nr:response regulator [Granulosicoccaceae sp. 1_MG-2023]